MSIEVVMILCKGNMLYEINVNKDRNLYLKLKEVLGGKMNRRFSKSDGDITFFAVNNNVIFACACKGEINCDKVFYFLADLENKFKLEFCNGKSLESFDENDLAISKDSKLKFESKIKSTLIEYNEKIKPTVIDKANKKVEEIKKDISRAISQQLENAELDEELLNDAEKIHNEAKEFNVEAKELKSEMKSRNFWLCSFWCVLIFAIIIGLIAAGLFFLFKYLLK